MPNIILDLMVDRVDLVDEGANSEAFIRLYKRKEQENAMTVEEILAKMKPEHAKVIQESIEKAKSDLEAATKKVELTEGELAKAKSALGEAEGKVTDLTEQVNKSKDKSEEPSFEEVLKSLDPSVQEVMKSLKAQKDAAEEVARQAAEKAATEEAVAKAKDLKSLPVEEDKLVEVLKSASPEVLEILKAANKAVEDGGLFEEVGKSKDNATQVSGSANDAWDKIEKAADKISEEQKVTKAKAIGIAVKENPDLYREYLKGGAN